MTKGDRTGRRTPRGRKGPPATTPAASLAVAEPTRVFISYRRGDSEPTAAHLRHSLGKVLGEAKIFRDLETLKPGQNFEAAIQEAIRSTTVYLVLIGREWLELRAPDGKRRLDAADDFVRLEIETALKAGVEVVPLLVDGARMPRARSCRRQLPISPAGTPTNCRGRPESDARYVARSYALRSLDDIREQLARGRPVIAGVNVQSSWLEDPIMPSSGPSSQ